MDPAIGPMVVMVTAILTAGGVAIFRPVTRRLGTLLEVMASERRLPDRAAEVAQLRELVNTLEARLSLMEERQDFAEALLSTGERRTPPALRSPARPPE